MNETSPPPAPAAPPPPPVLTGGKVPDLMPKKAGNVRFEYGTDRLTLRPNRSPASQIANLLFGLFFAYRTVTAFAAGQVGWAIFFALLALFDFFLVSVYFTQRGDQIVHDRANDLLSGKNGMEVAGLSDVVAVTIGKQNGVHNIAYVLRNGQTVRPALASTTFGKRSEAELAAQVVARFLNVPINAA